MLMINFKILPLKTQESVSM